MNKIPFNENELKVKKEVKNVFTGGITEIFDTPIPRGQNFENMLLKREVMWIPSNSDHKAFIPRCIPDNIARAVILDGGEPITPHTEGYKDMFGVEWVYVPAAGGSMPRTGFRLFDDANRWREFVKFPNIEELDWEEQKEISGEYVSNLDESLEVTIFNGYYERLISFMEFENAAVAMIDESQQTAVHELFEALTELYCGMLDKYTEYFHIGGVQLHDDWGSQRAPFFSLNTICEMLVPHIRKFTDYAHSLGLYVEFHCCGKNEMVVPAMIDAGFDCWSPQDINDVEMLHEQYGEKLVFAVRPPEISESSSMREIEEAAGAFVEKYAQRNAPAYIAGGKTVEKRLAREIYRLSRIKLAK